MRKLYFTVVLILCTFLSYAQTTQWIGPAGGDWSTAANWTNGVPAAGNDALITAGSDIAINNPLIIDYGVTNFSGDIAVNADVFNIGNFINSGGNMSLSNGALFLNSGAVTFTNDGPFSNDGDFFNYGTFNQNGNGVFDNNPTGRFINYGNITNVGNFTNNGTVENYGNLTNASTFVNNALTTNCGQFINTFVSTLDNNASATFHNKAGAQLFIDKDFNNAGTLNDDGSSTVNASGVVNNTGTININGLFQVSTVFNNDGIVNVAGSYKSNFGTTNNNSTWNNSGRTENLGTFNNNAGSALANTGTLMNASCANFYQRSNGTINSMTNDGVLYELNGTVNVSGASQGVALQNANIQPTPVLICRDIQIQTDDNGEVSITAGDVLVDGDAKYCNIVTLEVTQTDFTCADLGVNPVTVTLTDGFNNSNTCTVDVTVVERSPNPCNNSYLNYCASSSSNAAANEYIRVVSLEGINNVTARAGYTDYTAQVASLEFGNFYDLEIEKRGANQTSTTSVWIDWNNDGDFTDADENVLTETSTENPAFLSSVINVPGTALPGTTRMRVAMTRGDTAPTPCATLPNGEVEDYTIMIASDIIIQNCVGDIVVSAAPGATEQVVGWIPPKGFSTCQNGIEIEFVSGLDNGSAFPLGETVNTLRFVDGCGNEKECDFTVTVNPTPVTFSLACRDDVILTASAGLGGAIANWTPPFPNATCPQGVNLPTQTVGPTQGEFLPTGTRVTVCYESTDNCGNTDNCCFEVFVTDPAESLTFDNCPSVIAVDGTAGAAGTVVTYPTFTATSSCAAGGLNIILQDGLPSGSIFPNGNTTVTYRATDDCNSAALCSFVVTVNPTPSEVTVNCPDDIAVDVNPGSPSQVVNYPAVTATSDCPGPIQITQTQGLPSGNAFPLGNTVVQYMVNDACGDMENCTFNVTLNTQGATTSINCPNDVTVNANPGDVGAVVTWTTPNATSDCFTGNASVTLVSALSSGDQFPLGTQEVIYFASDDCGTSDGCSFFVTVEPTQANLNLTCRNNIVRNINVGAANPTVSWAAATGTTTCGGNVNITQIAGPTAGSAFAPGATTITYRGTDNCGNVEICSFDVIVNITTPVNAPEITVNCLNDINVTAAPGQTVASVGFDVPTATTTCNAGGGGNVGGGSTVCTTRTATNVAFCTTGEQYGFALRFDGVPNNFYRLANGQFTENTDGTAQLTGVITNTTNDRLRFLIDVNLSGRTTTAPLGSPKDGSCETGNSSDFYYYQNLQGVLTGRRDLAGATVNITGQGPVFQIGSGADITGINTTLGASAWFLADVVRQPNAIITLVPNTNNGHDGDINIKLSGDVNTCRDNGKVGCNTVSENISGYTFIGELDNSKYYVTNTATSWTTAQANAVAAGGHLATVTSQAENDFINNNGTASSGSFWLGLQNVNLTPTFQWVNGEPVSYTNWNDGEPNETHQQVYARLISGTGKWTDRLNSATFNGVLEIECQNNACEPTSTLKREVWTGLDNTYELANVPFNTAPNLTDAISTFEIPLNDGSNFATRVSGYVIPPVSGNYTFWLSSDDTGELWLSTNDNPANKQLIANIDTYSNFNQWDKFASQQSVAIQLEAGKAYYIEALMKEVSGGDHLSVGWRLPDGTLNRPITSQYLSETPCGGTVGGGSTEATVTQVAGLAPNTNFPIGTTTIVYEVTDDCGNTAYCEFDVTVNQPNSAIALNNCPTDITVTAAAGGTSAVANFTAPTATSDCTQGNVVVSQIGGFASGQAFPVGQTTVSYRAVDGCGNEQFCSFFVIVEATAPPATDITVNCRNNIAVDAAIGANSAPVTFAAPTATTTCNGNVNITQIGGLPSGSDFPIGQTVIFYRLADGCGNFESCAFNVVVNSTPASISINCPANVSVDAAPDAEYATATFAQATAASDCFTGTETITQIGGLPSGSLLPVGNSVVFFKATDACGNFAVCNFLITVNATPITNLSECINAGGDADGDGVCADIDCDDNNPLVSQAGDSCNDGNPATSNDVIQADCSCAGVIVYDCPALSANIGDACNDGNPNTSDDTVQADCNCLGVFSGDNLVLTCPDDILLDPVPGNLVTFDWTAPTGTTDCTAGGLNITQTQGPTPGTQLLANNSVYDIQYQATDNCGNTATCAFTVTEQTFTAQIEFTSCPDEIIVDATGSTGAIVSWQAPELFTDCPDGASIIQSTGLASGSEFPIGTTEVVFQGIGNGVGNGCGVSTVCIFDVTVNPLNPTFDCPALSANIGDSCDDGNANTTGDSVQSDCTCAGTPVQTGCTATYTLNGLDIDFSNVDAPISTVKVFDNSFATIFACDNFGGTACADNFTVTVPSAGTYFIQIQTYQDWATNLCDVFETVEIGGTPPVYDCPALSANIGDACNDGNTNTNNDVIQSDCSCAGTPVGTTLDCPALSANIGDACDDGNANTNGDSVQSDCSCAGTPVSTGCDVTYVVNGMDITISNINAPISAVKVLTANYQTIFSCDDWTTACANVETITVPSAGDYLIQVQTYQDWSTPLCDFLETVTVGGGTPTFDCPALSADIGDACNDGNANTNNDVVQADCSCAGTPTNPTFDCPTLSANIGDACDDGDATTNGDSIQSDCSCAGTPVATTCTATYAVNGMDIELNNLAAPISSVTVFDNTFTAIFSCNNFGGTACNNNETVTAPQAGTYFVSIQTYADWSNPLCNIFEEVTVTTGGSNNNCNPLTDGGAIIGDETVCPTDDPQPISNSAVPTGGSGTVEYIWVSSTTTCPTSPANPIAGATQSTYDPGSVSQTTYFRRYARRTGCTDWLAGESNCIVKTLDTNCITNNACNATYTVSGMDITLNNIADNIAASAIFDNSFTPVFQCNNFGGTACNNTETVTVPAPGTYFIQIQTYSDWSNQLCNIFEEVTVTGNAQLQRINDNTEISTKNNLEATSAQSISDFKVFPNPAMGSVNVALKDFQNRNVEIRLVSQLGQTLKTVALQSVNKTRHEVNLAGITNGIYTIVIFAEGQAPISKKLIVRRGF